MLDSMSNDNSNSTSITRTPVDPWPWSLALGYHQTEIIEGVSRQVTCAGQTSVDGEGSPMHIDDMRSQISLALDNLETVLSGAGMTLADVTRLGVYATDVDEAMKHFDVLGSRFGPTGAAPPMTLLGVSRLAVPGLMFEIEASAAD